MPSAPAITLSPGGGFLLEPTGSVTIFTPEMLSDEQRMMQETADDFVIREVLPHVKDIEAKKPGLMRELLQKAGAVGLLGHDVPEEFGGLGGDKTSSSLITEAASRLGSLAVSFGAHVGIGTMPIVLFGTLEQRKKYLPKLASGEMIAAYALTEPGSGSDALAAKTKAVKSADGKSWKLHRVEAVHHQRRLRRSVHGVREGGRRAVHRVPGRARRARADHRSRGAQARHPRQLDLPAVPRGLHDPDRRGAGDDRPGAQDRLQHPEHRALEAGRRVGRRARSIAWSWA